MIYNFTLNQARKLEENGVLISKQLRRAKFYEINFSSEYAKQYIKFLLKKESEQSLPFIKRWINELKKVKSADLVILFGSILENGERARDIDVLFVTDQKSFNKLKKEINS